MPGLSLRTSAGVLGQRTFMALLLLFFVGLSVQYSHKALSHRSAIMRWQPQLLGMETGEDISGRYAYPNPPIMAVLLFPLAKLGSWQPLAMALIWFYLKVGLVLLSLRWVFQFVAEEGRPFPAWAKGLTVLLSIRPIVGDLQHGNVNIFILFLFVAALKSYTTKRDFQAGLLLGLAIACKVTPALFIPYFLWKRAWRSLAGCSVGLVLFLWPGFVPALLLGWQENQHQLTSWYNEMVYPYVVEGKVWSEYNNQSLPGLVARLMTPSASFCTYVNDVYTPTEYDNFLSLNRRQAKWIIQGCQLLFAALVLWRCRTPREVRGGWRLSAEFSIVVIGMLLFSERTWKHHCVTLMLPFAVLCYYLAVEASAARRRWLIGALVGVSLLLTTTSTELFEEFAKRAQLYGAYVAAFGLLLATLCAMLKRSEPEA